MRHSPYEALYLHAFASSTKPNWAGIEVIAASRRRWERRFFWITPGNVARPDLSFRCVLLRDGRLNEIADDQIKEIGEIATPSIPRGHNLNLQLEKNDQSWQCSNLFYARIHSWLVIGQKILTFWLEIGVTFTCLAPTATPYISVLQHL